MARPSLNALVMERKCFSRGIVPAHWRVRRNDRRTFDVRSGRPILLWQPNLRARQPREAPVEPKDVQEPRDIAARRLSMIIEQYVGARKRRYDFVSTDQAARVIRRILKPADPALSDRKLDDMVAALAVKNGLAVVFDRGVRAPTDAAEADLNRKEPTMRAPTETPDVAGAVDAILAAQATPLSQITPLSMRAVISLLRERTGTKRSDADLEGLIAKKAAVLDVHLSRNG
ncbi:hypothetical protein [Mesorhizobium huakuii]|uniref:hypothetical protein n=1 Tax=Mesorhizobium huakuii TaxID=28104 RepID=UPI0024E0E620|nr:hypothetical protein [Mesorhizobium huakuii]